MNLYKELRAKRCRETLKRLSKPESWKEAV